MIKSGLIEFQKDLTGIPKRDNRANNVVDIYEDSSFYNILMVKSDSIDRLNSNSTQIRDIEDGNRSSSKINSPYDNSKKPHNDSSSDVSNVNQGTESKDKRSGETSRKQGTVESKGINSSKKNEGVRRVINSKKADLKSGLSEKIIKALKDKSGKVKTDPKKLSGKNESIKEVNITGRNGRAINTEGFIKNKYEKSIKSRNSEKHTGINSRKKIHDGKIITLKAVKTEDASVEEGNSKNNGAHFKRLFTDKGDEQRTGDLKVLKRSKTGKEMDHNRGYNQAGDTANEINRLLDNDRLKGKGQVDKNGGGFKFEFTSLLKRYDSNIPIIRGESTILNNFSGNGAEKIFGDIIKHFSYIVTNGGGEAKLILKPPELGNLKMNIKVENGKVSAIIIVDNPTIKEIIDSRLNILHQNLLEQGFSLGSFEVGVKEQKSEGNLTGNAYKTPEASDRLIEEDVSGIGEEEFIGVEATLPWMSAYINLTV